MVRISSSTTERCLHNSHKLFWVSFSTARVAATICGSCLSPAPCSPACGGFEGVVVVVAMVLPLPQDLDKHVFQVRFDRLDRKERQILRAYLGEQVVEPGLVRDRPADARLPIFGGDREAVEPRRGGRREGAAQPNLIGLLAEAIKQRA